MGVSICKWKIKVLYAVFVLPYLEPKFFMLIHVDRFVMSYWAVCL